MQVPLKVGVIGVGYLGRYHADKYAALPGVKLVGVADLTLERCREVARALNTEAFTDYRHLLPEVDAVSVAVNTPDHYAVVREALEAGLPRPGGKAHHRHRGRGRRPPAPGPRSAAASSWWGTWSALTAPWRN